MSDIVDVESRPAEGRRDLAPGTKVEVKRRFDDRWARGFEIAEADERGYRILRLSDRTVIPISFDCTDVRKERKSSWWY